MYEEGTDGACLFVKQTGQTKLVTLKGVTFYKVKVDGEMMSKTIQKTCHSYSLVTPCEQYGKYHSDGPLCINIFPGESGFKYILAEISKAICNTSTYESCSTLDGVFIARSPSYSRGGGLGIYAGRIVRNGNEHTGQYALCANQD